MKNLSIIGSSGSIGKQVKRIVMRYPDLFRITAVCVRRDLESLYEDAQTFHPSLIGVADEEAAKKIDVTRLGGARVVTGELAAVECARAQSADTLVACVVGMTGLRAVYEGILSGKEIAIANKESLVTGGEIVMKEAALREVEILPIDSEHAAIWQCLRAGRKEDVARLILTASGGPFRGKKRTDLQSVTAEQALRHPTWKMGAKITVDSATLMNKGLEIIEASRLFGIGQIDTVVQPTSIVHSMVEYKDGSVLAQMSNPTMEIPIQLALTDPLRFETEIPRLDFNNLGTIAFETLDEETFGCVRLAKEALRRGGYAPTVLNAADEAAVDLFLNGKIKFLQIEEMIAEALASYRFDAQLTIDGIYEADAEVKSRILSKYNPAAV